VNDKLHPLLLLLTLCDLGFVHATGAVSSWVLLPLWIMAIASLRLRSLQTYYLYRGGWNACVLLTFSLLVHHATTTGMLHLLEDGLVLAVLCQVHLLNNIGDRQRPDLTFFNSFLIAFVTSFFAPDFWWSLLFIGHAFLFVPALQVYVLTKNGRDITIATWRHVIRDSMSRTAIVSAITVLAFVFWPRDFQRTGWLRETLSLGPQLQVGLSNRIDLERDKSVTNTDQITLRIETIDGDPTAIPSHWRVRVFSEFDGATWYPQDGRRIGSWFVSDSPWTRQKDNTWRRPARGNPHTRFRVKLFGGHGDRLPTTLAAVIIEPRQTQGRSVVPTSDAGFTIVQASGLNVRPMIYTVGIAQPKPVSGLSELSRAHFTTLPPRGIPKLAYDLGYQIRNSLPLTANDLELATAACNWLQSNRRYELPGKPGFADNLGEFLLGTAAGHCEYFATTLALMLRTQGVPCRLVGGYLVHEESTDKRAMIARGLDAHAWVEVLAEDGTWHMLDATPAGEAIRADRNAVGFWHHTKIWLQSLWIEITGFDDDARNRWMTSIITFPVRRPITCLFAALLLALWISSRHRKQLPAIANFEKALRKSKITRLPGETPRELIKRASQLKLNEKRFANLQAAAAAHEVARYR
jgi:transglutaminase-like putative cysteine protease